MSLLNKYRDSIVGACHVNYHKRVDSHYDTSIVEKYCKLFKIPLLIHHVTKNEYKKAGENIEV